MNQKQRFIYNISQLSTEAKELLEGTFPLIWVEGEISNFSCPSSGHWYFTLKDSRSQVRSAMFRMRNMHIPFQPKNGDQVLIRARVSLYTARGDFQLIAEHMEEAGDGALRRAYEALKTRLQSEGLFEARHKLEIPPHPQRIGIITSPTGAAIRDILHVLKRRAPSIPVTLYPAAVQGEQAAEHIIEALQSAIDERRCDTLIIGRGGGSIEDLWAFNSEPLARLIYSAPIPVISAVGHEIDYTICDFVADQRAPTPSAAAEMASPDHSVWQHRLEQLKQRLARSALNHIDPKKQQLAWLQQRIRHPQQKIMEQSQHLDEIEQQLIKQIKQIIKQKQQRVELLAAQVQQNIPSHQLTHYDLHLQQLSRRLHRRCENILHDRKQVLTQHAHHLNTVSPLATLSRGYSVVTHEKSGAVIRSSEQVNRGDKINIRLNQGQIEAIVEPRHDH